jgi:hypothetical protein
MFFRNDKEIMNTEIINLISSKLELLLIESHCKETENSSHLFGQNIMINISEHSLLSRV